MCMKTAAASKEQSLQSAERNQRLTNAPSSFPAKLVRISWTELDLGYPRDRIYVPVWEVLGKFIKLELWGGHSASIFLQMNSYKYV